MHFINHFCTLSAHADICGDEFVMQWDYGTIIIIIMLSIIIITFRIYTNCLVAVCGGAGHAVAVTITVVIGVIAALFAV